MSILEMHELFRVLGQRMGLQNVRGIIPEEIDTIINSAITSFIKQTIQSNATLLFDDNVLQHNTPIGYLNPIRTLYKVVPKSSLNQNEVMYYISFSLEHNGKRYKARLVEADRIDEMNADYCSRASLEYPIVTLYNSGNSFVFETYPSDINYNNMFVRYIKNPAKVSSTGSVTVDCDLPDYTHDDIVKIAVTQYFQSLNLTTQQLTNQ